MKIAIASDHGGVNLKKELINYLIELGHIPIDLSLLNNEDDDYPDFALIVAKNVNEKEAEIGILICKSGIGMSIAANKVKGIYCGLVNNIEEAKSSRLHNGCNVIALNGNLELEEAKNIIYTLINTEILNDQRHIRRFKKITQIEQGQI